MNVVVTGATGFTGTYTIPLLLKNNIKVRCLVRNTSNIDLISKSDVELIYGDLNDQASIERAFEGVHALINIASLGFGHARNVVQAAVRKNIQRAIFISTTALFTRLNARSKSVRLNAEDIIKKSGLDYTIIRPTMIYGSSMDRNICRLIKFINRWPIFIVFGNGTYLQQPVFVEDVSSAIMGALLSAKTSGKSYNIAGAVPVTFNQMIDTLFTALNRKIYKIHIPASPIVSVLEYAERLGLHFPIKAEQVLRLNEDKRFDYTDAKNDFGYNPICFSEGVRKEIMEMRRSGQLR
jgi:nucleoside-diphosphate-sugar epimerase